VVAATNRDNSAYTQYVAKLSPVSRGRWRLRAYGPADANHCATWSSYRNVRVK
jgi:hypothetical protein